MSDTDTAIKQAELILKLYELRREPVMRSARSYVGGEFLPRSLEDFLAIMSAGDQYTAYVLQVYGYWDMVAALAFHGALDEGLVYNTCPEMCFQFAKIWPYLEEFRSKSSLPELFHNVQKLVEGSEMWGTRRSVVKTELPACCRCGSHSSVEDLRFLFRLSRNAKAHYPGESLQTRDSLTLFSPELGMQSYNK